MTLSSSTNRISVISQPDKAGLAAQPSHAERRTVTTIPPASSAPAPARVARRPDITGAVRAVLLMVVSLAVMFAAYLLFVQSSAGQRLDQMVVTRTGQGPLIRETVSSVLQLVTVGLIVLVLCVCVVIAGLRQRWELAAGAFVIVAGANVSTQGLKRVLLDRPDFGYGTENSLPSGHVTVVMSLVLALLLVLPSAARWVMELGGSVAVAVIGVGVVVTTWHYPSDVISALAVALAWGFLVLAAISLLGVDRPIRRQAVTTLALALGLLLSAGIFIAFGVRPGGSLKDFAILAVTMAGLATAGALSVGVFTRMLDARVA